MTSRDLALAAAMGASDATAELVRFAKEGEGIRDVFETELIEQLLDAAKISMEISGQHLESEVYSAIVKFLEGWA